MKKTLVIIFCFSVLLLISSCAKGYINNYKFDDKYTKLAVLGEALNFALNERFGEQIIINTDREVVFTISQQLLFWSYSTQTIYAKISSYVDGSPVLFIKEITILEPYFYGTTNFDLLVMRIKDWYDVIEKKGLNP